LIRLRGNASGFTTVTGCAAALPLRFLLTCRSLVELLDLLFDLLQSAIYSCDYVCVLHALDYSDVCVDEEVGVHSIREKPELEKGRSVSRRSNSRTYYGPHSIKDEGGARLISSGAPSNKGRNFPRNEAANENHGGRGGFGHRCCAFRFFYSGPKALRGAARYNGHAITSGLFDGFKCNV